MGKIISDIMPKDFNGKDNYDYIDLYYYYRDKNNRPMVVVCLLLEVNHEPSKIMVHKGYAICGPKDNPFSDYGKSFAFARASDAMKLGRRGKYYKSKKKRLLPIKREEAFETLEMCNCTYLKGLRKGQYNSKAHNEYEEKLLQPIFEMLNNQEGPHNLCI